MKESKIATTIEELPKKNSFKENFQNFKKKLDSKANSFLKKLPRIITKLLRYVARLLAGAFIFYFMAGLVPSMREAAPHFYQIVDLLILVFDKMCAVLTKYLH